MPTSARQPNILIYCTDQQRADLLGCMGHPQIRTPHIDALATRGVLLRNLFIQGPVCMPSRSSILTGRYPSAHGVVDNGFDLPTSEQTLGDHFSRAGYHTAVVGRTHLRCSMPHPVLPSTGYYGFQECHHQQCYWTGLDPYGDYLRWIQKNHPTRYEEAAMANPVNRPEAHGSSWSTLDDDKTMTAWVTTQSLDVLRRHRDGGSGRPIMLWAGTWDPHSRFVTSPPWDRMYPPDSIPLPVERAGEWDDLPPHYKTKAPKTGWSDKGVSREQAIRNTLSVYWGMISHVDDQFGRLMRGLDELGMAEDTVVVFMSDHGEMGGDHGIWAKGAYWFDAALRVPGIIAAPGRLPAGRSTDALVETIDLAPTLLAMAGLNAPEAVQGRSCLGLLEGETETHRPDALTEHRDLNVSGERMWSLRTATHRLTHYAERPYGELFDLRSDPHQLRNLWNDPAHAGAKNELRVRLLDRVPTLLTRGDTRAAMW